MKTVKFIYNPHSGDKSILKKLDLIIEMYQEKGLIIEFYRIEQQKDVENAFKDFNPNRFSHVLIAGGDGTVDSVINAMYRLNIKLPIAILPTGTANDFAKFLGIPTDIEEACKNILSSIVKTVDIAKINDRYFVNVASTGLFAEVSQKTDINLKNTIGKLAYYIKGIEELPNFKKINIKIESKECSYDGETYLILVFNGKTAGNFNIATKSKINDGLLDVIVFKAMPVKEMFYLLLTIFKGEHITSENVLYFKTDKIKIECNDSISTDIDGEIGPQFPLNIECIKDGISILGATNI